MVGLSLLSLTLIAADAATPFLQPLRSGVETLVSPVFQMAEFPYLAADWIADHTVDQAALRERIDQLTQRNLELSHLSLQAEALRAENNQMRELLGSRPKVGHPVLIAEIIGLVPVPSVHEVVIDKGLADGVQVGHAALGAKGLAGQVVSSNPFSARVLLITDSRHSLPVEVLRNGQRGIVSGTGKLDRLDGDGMPVTADIRVGDRLVASGLGGRFPSGYPVGEVLSVRPDPARMFASIEVRPSASLGRSKHVLVVLREQGGEPS